MRQIGLQAMALLGLSVIRPCSGGIRVPDVMITSPLDGAVLQADEVLLLVDISGLGENAKLSNELVLCIDVEDKRRCFDDYQFGNEADRIFATYLQLGGSAGSYRISAFAAVRAREAEVPTNHSESDQGSVFDLLTPQESVVTIHSVAAEQCTPPEQQRKVFDAFMFSTEVDLLELRLRELWGVVDHFILVEANVTHTLKPKPFVYEQHKSRFAAYASKVIHVAIESDYLEQHRGRDAWDTETLQRDTIVHALKGFGARGHDVVLISDVDEIPKPEVVTALRDCKEAMPGGLRLYMDWYLYNGRHRHREQAWGRIGGEGPIAIEARWLDETRHTPTKARRHMRKGTFRAFYDMTWGVVRNAGWHFSSFGRPQAVRDKLLAYADEPFAASGFLLQPHRMERLQHFGVPYFWLRSLQVASDSPFGPVTDAGPITYPSTLGPPPATPNPATSGLSNTTAEERTEEEESLRRLRRLFFPPPPDAQAEPSVSDPQWLEQDLRAARLYMDGFDVSTPPSAIKARNMAPFDFDCHGYEEQVAAFCVDHGPMCAQDLPGFVDRACRESDSRFGRLYVDLVEPVELLPLRGEDAGGQRREYIVEWRQGDRPSGVVEEERGLGGYAPSAEVTVQPAADTPGANGTTAGEAALFSSVDIEPDSPVLPRVEPGGLLADESAATAHRGGGALGWESVV